MAGGTGSRLAPLTNIINKHFLPVYNKPMIFYPLSTLVYAGIKEILIVCNPGDDLLYEKILKVVCNKHKLKIHYRIQNKIGAGIAEGLLISKNFIERTDKVAFILGDNFFYGTFFSKTLNKYLINKERKSFIFLSEVSNPKEYGVPCFNKQKLLKIIEKPTKPQTNIAVTGLYIYDKSVTKILNLIRPSQRSELEITSVNNLLLEANNLDYIRIGRGTAWFDLGNYENILDCAELIKLLEKRKGLKVCNL